MQVKNELLSLLTESNSLENISLLVIKQWHNNFDRAKLLHAIKSYEQICLDEGLLATLSEDQPNKGERDQLALAEIYSQIKNVRKAAQYLRTSYILLDRQHEAPKELAAFYWFLGQLKDAFYKPYLTKQIVISLQNLLESPLSKLDAVSIDVDTPHDIWQIMQQPLQIIERLVANEGDMSANSFHTLRKKLRLFANLFTLAAKSSNEVNVLAMKNELVSINDVLGEINDEFVADSLDGHKPYEDNRVLLDNTLKERISNLLCPPHNLSSATNLESFGND